MVAEPGQICMAGKALKPGVCETGRVCGVGSHPPPLVWGLRGDNPLGSGPLPPWQSALTAHLFTHREVLRVSPVYGPGRTHVLLVTKMNNYFVSTFLLSWQRAVWGQTWLHSVAPQWGQDLAWVSGGSESPNTPTLEGG